MDEPIFRCLVIGDPHVKFDNKDKIDKLIDKVIEIIEESEKKKKINPTEEIDVIVVLGDLLHRHEKIYTEELEIASNMLNKLRKIKTTVSLIGNHDRINNSEYLTHTHPFIGHKKWENLYIVDSPTYLYVGKNDKYRAIACPYVPVGKFQEALDKLDNDTIKKGKKSFKEFPPLVIFAHQELRGCKMGVITSNKGDKWPKENPLIISGHIHEHQIMGNIFYPGTPFQHDFNESEDKGIYLFTFYEGRKYSYNKINLDIKKKKNLKLTISDYMKFDIKDYKDYDVKVNIQDDLSQINSMKDDIRKKAKIEQIKISFKPNRVIEKISSTKRGFLPILFEKIKGNEMIEKLFNEIFEDDLK